MINTNIMSLNAQRQLNKSQLTQNQAMERLSSGLRINSAKDDAAGLAISTGMQSQIRGINQAVRNSNDGISMAQTAEGSMDEMSNILQRMRELSVQAASDTNSADNKASIQQEVDQLYSEIDRIATTTQFNGCNLLNGSNGATTLQIGANSGETLTFEIPSVTTASLGLDGGVNKGDLNGGRVGDAAIGVGTVAINGVDLSAVSADGGAAEMAKAINLGTASSGVVADAYNVVEGASLDAEGVALSGITDGLTLKVGAGEAITLGPTSSMKNLAETINRDVPGVTATVGEGGNLILNNDSGETIEVVGDADGGSDTAAAAAGLEPASYNGYIGLTSQSGEVISVGPGSEAADDATNEVTKILGFMVSNGSAITSGAAATGVITEADAITINGVALELSADATAQKKIDAINELTDETGVTATLGADDTIVFTAGDGGDIVIASGAKTEAGKTAALEKLGMIDVGGTTVSELGLSVATAQSATSSLGKIDEALAKISDSRSSLGAIQNRLGSTISNLENVAQNLSSANSRIQDADFAAETSKMSKAQILQQAGTSMLSQANASTQNVLSLLQG